MKALTNRIQRLEARLAPQPDMEAYRLAQILYERRRRRMEREGVPSDELPEFPTPPAGAINPMSLTLSLEETHRRRRELREQRAAASGLGPESRCS